MLPKRSRKPNSQRAYFFLQESELLSANPIQYKSLKLAVRIVLFLFVLLERMILWIFFSLNESNLGSLHIVNDITIYISSFSIRFPSSNSRETPLSLLPCTRLYQDHDKQKSSMRQFEPAVIKQKQSEQASVVERRKYK